MIANVFACVLRKEDLDKFNVPAHRGEMQRRLPVFVPRIDVRAVLQKKFCDLVSVIFHGQMQRRRGHVIDPGNVHRFRMLSNELFRFHHVTLDHGFA